MKKNYQTDEETVNENGFLYFYNNNKKLIWILLILIFFILFATLLTRKSQNNQSVGIVFDNNTDMIMVGSSKRISASIIDKSSYDVKYSSDDDNIIVVDSYGLVSGIGVGSTNLKAYYYDSNGKEHAIERTITVFEGNNKIELREVSLPDGAIVMKLYDEYNLANKLIVNPSTGYIYKKVFKSSNNNIVSVDDNGKLTALKEGEVIINVNVNNKFDCNIRVYVLKNQLSTEIVKLPESIDFNKLLLKLKVGDIYKIDYIIKPSDAVGDYLKWTSSNSSIVEVDNTGTIKALKEGNCDITVSSINGKNAKLFVEVSENRGIKKISFKEDVITLKENETYKLLPIIEPNNIVNDKLTFASENTDIVKIKASDNIGATLLALKEGKTLVTVKSDSGISSTIRVVVSSKNSNEISNRDGAITVRINGSITPAKIYSNDLKYTDPANISISMSDGVKMVKYCYAPYINAICEPNLTYSSSFRIPSGSVYRLRIQKYDSEGREIIGSNSDNYRNGALEYYINTKNDDVYKDIGYTMTGNYYETITEANKNILNEDSKISFKFINTVTDEIKICYTTSLSCNPDDNPNKIIKNNTLDKSIDINKNGIWKIFISEYSQGNRVGKTKEYYVVIEKNDCGYILTGNYHYSIIDANSNPVSGQQRINFEYTNDKVNKLKICFTNGSSCDPDKTPDKVIVPSTISKYIDIHNSGLWRIYVSEYKDDSKIGDTKIYYLKHN